MYQPSDGLNKLELFEGNTTSNATLSIKHLYNGNGTSDLDFTTSDAGRHASIKYWGNLQSLKHYIAGSVKFSLGQTNSVLSTTLLPNTDSQYDLGSNTLRWANVYADTLYGDGSNLTGISLSSSRASANATTGTIANNASANITIAAAKTYALLKIQTSAAAWVTLYTDAASRASDASRNETTDPTPGSGVIAEVITTGAATQIMTPGLIGWNNDGTVSTNVYAKVVNKSGSAGAITVTLHYVTIES